jgi:hypothetical protein
MKTVTVIFSMTNNVSATGTFTDVYVNAYTQTHKTWLHIWDGSSRECIADYPIDRVVKCTTSLSDTEVT